MAGNCEDLSTLVHEEDPHWDIEVGVAGLLVVVEDTDAITCTAENTPALLPALREGEKERERGRGKRGRGKRGRRREE